MNAEIKRALYLNDEELLEEILDARPDLANLKIDEERNVRIIHKASQIENANLITMLIEKGADIDVQDSNLWTPIMIAAMNGNL